MRGFVADLHHAVRVYLTTPAASLLAVAVLAIAMAAVSSLLSLFSDLVLKSHPGFEASNELVTIGRNDGTRFMPLSKKAVERLREDMPALATLTGTSFLSFELEPAPAEDMSIEFVARDFFATMRPRLALGRGFDASEHDVDAEPVAVIAYEYWQTEFGGAPDVIGRTLSVSGTPMLFRFDPDDPPSPQKQTIEPRIIGVMAKGASTFGLPIAAWLPFERAAPVLIGDESALEKATMLYALARVDTAIRVEALVNELAGRFGDVEEFSLAPGVRLDAMRGVALNPNAQRDAARQVRLLLVGGVLLALVAASNVSLFLLSRSPGRRRELAIRMAVGAPLRRLARQLATEAGLLVVVAAIFGVLIGAWLNVGMQDLSVLRNAQWRNVSLDWRVLSLVGGFALLLTALVSLGPIMGLKRLGLAAGSRSVTARPSATQHVAGNLQIAAACVLAGVAGAFAWYLTLLLTEDHGYTTENIHLVTLAPQQGNLAFFDRTDYDAVLAERDRRRQAALALPGIEAVAFGTTVPGRQGFSLSGRFEKEDGSGEFIQFTIISCDPAYLELLDMTIVDGRGLAEADRTGMVVNETFARQMWGRTDVAGEVFPGGFGESEQTDVVGVVVDVSFGHPSADVEPRAFIFATPFINLESLLIRSRLSPGELRTLLQSAIDAGALEFEIGNVERLADVASELIAADRARSLIAAATALLVVVLAAFGFYGTERFLVAAGRREFAIRAALGAGPRALGRLVLARGLLLGAPGLGFGTLLAFIAVAWMRQDFVPDSVNPVVIALGVLVAIGALLIAAALGPARVARRTDAGPLLKQE